MPIKKAAFKALRQSRKKTLKNQKTNSDIKALVKRTLQAVAAKDAVKAADWLKQAVKKIDKAAVRKLIKKNTAARQKSRLTRKVNALAPKS